VQAFTEAARPIVEFKMNKIIIPVIASILILGTLGLTDAFAGNHGNNGNNGCENANPNAKACEKNPNAGGPSIDPTEGLHPFDFTITDPEGRMQTGDVVVFYKHWSSPNRITWIHTCC